MTTPKSKIRPSLKLSVFLKCVSILAVTTAIVASVIAITSDRAIRDIAN